MLLIKVIIALTGLVALLFIGVRDKIRIFQNLVKGHIEEEMKKCKYDK